MSHRMAYNFPNWIEKKCAGTKVNVIEFGVRFHCRWKFVTGDYRISMTHCRFYVHLNSLKAKSISNRKQRRRLLKATATFALYRIIIVIAFRQFHDAEHLFAGYKRQQTNKTEQHQPK